MTTRFRVIVEGTLRDDLAKVLAAFAESVARQQALGADVTIRAEAVMQIELENDHDESTET